MIFDFFFSFDFRLIVYFGIDEFCFWLWVEFCVFLSVFWSLFLVLKGMEENVDNFVKFFFCDGGGLRVDRNI